MGWIKLYRKIQDSAIWNNDTPFDPRSAWIDLLLMATHKDIQMVERQQPFTLKAGQIKTSKKHLADRWHWTRNRVERYIKMLKKLKMISEMCTANGTTLTIENWAFYQHRGETDEAPDGAPDGATGGASDGAPDGAQTRSKEIKNIKNEKNNIAPPASSWGGEWQ